MQHVNFCFRVTFGFMYMREYGEFQLSCDLCKCFEFPRPKSLPGGPECNVDSLAVQHVIDIIDVAVDHIVYIWCFNM